MIVVSFKVSKAVHFKCKKSTFLHFRSKKLNSPMDFLNEEWKMKKKNIFERIQRKKNQQSRSNEFSKCVYLFWSSSLFYYRKKWQREIGRNVEICLQHKMN